MASVEEVEEEEEEDDEEESTTKKPLDGLSFLGVDLSKCECVRVDPELPADRHLIELVNLVKKHETKLEPIDQELLELGPFAKERHDVHHDWPLPLELHPVHRKRTTGRGAGRGRRVKSTDELSPLAGTSPELRREPIKKPRKKRAPKGARSPSWPSELVNYPTPDTHHPAHHVGEPITAPSGLINQRDARHLVPSSSSQESTAAEAMLALSASHVPVDSTTRSRSFDGSYARSPSSDGDSMERSPSSAQAEGDIRLSRQPYSELYPPSSTSPLVSECHRAVPHLHNSEHRHEPALPAAMLRSHERDTASPITEHPHGGFVAPQVLHPGVVSKHKQYPNLPQLSRLPDQADGRRLSGGSLPGVGHVVEDSRTQRFSPSPIASRQRQQASATPPPVVFDEKIDSRFGPANPFWPVPPGQQLQQQQQQLEVSQASLPSNFSLPYVPTGWPGAATPFRTQFLPGLSSFPRSSVLPGLDIPSSSSASPNSYRPVMPPYYFIAPQYQLAMAAATGMKPPYVNSPIPSSSPSSSLPGGALPYATAVATSPNPPSSHLSAFKSLQQNVRSFTPPSLHPLSSTNREEKPTMESPVQANKWIQAPTIIGSQFPAGTPLYPSTFALNAAQAALVPQMNLIGGAAALPQAHLSPSANEQLQMRASPPISTRRVVRGRRGAGGNPDAGSMSPNPEHLAVRGPDQSIQLHENLEAEYRRWQASQDTNAKHTSNSVVPSGLSEGGRPSLQQTAMLSYGGSPNKESRGRIDVRTSPEKMKLKIHEPMNDEDFRGQEKGADRRRKKRNWRRKDDKDDQIQPDELGVLRPLPPQVQRPGGAESNSHSTSQGEQDFIIDITTVDEGTTLPNPLRELHADSSPIPPLPSSIHTAPVSTHLPSIPHTQPDPALLQREASPVSLSSANTLLLLSKGQTTTAGQFDSSHLPLSSAAREDDISSEGTMSAAPSSPVPTEPEDKNHSEEPPEEPVQQPLEVKEPELSPSPVDSRIPSSPGFSVVPITSDILQPSPPEEETNDPMPTSSTQETSTFVVQGRSTRSDSFSAAETMLLIAQGEEDSSDEQNTSETKEDNPPASDEQQDISIEEDTEEVPKEVFEPALSRDPVLPADSPTLSSSPMAHSPPVQPAAMETTIATQNDITEEDQLLLDEPKDELPVVGYQLGEAIEEEDFLTIHADENIDKSSPLTSDSPRRSRVDSSLLSTKSSAASLVIDESLGCGSDSSPPVSKKPRLDDLEEEEGEIQEDKDSPAEEGPEIDDRPTVTSLPSWSEFEANTTRERSHSSQRKSPSVQARSVSPNMHKKSTSERLPQLKKPSFDVSEKSKNIGMHHHHGGQVSKHSHPSASKLCSKLEKRLSAMVSKQVGSSAGRNKPSQNSTSTSKEKSSWSFERETSSSSSKSSSSSESKTKHANHQLALPPRDPQWRHSNSREPSSSRGHTPTTANHSGEESTSPVPASSYHRSSSSSSRGSHSKDKDRNSSKKGHSFYTSSPPERHSSPSSSSHRHHHHYHHGKPHSSAQSRNHEDHRDHRHQKSPGLYESSIADSSHRQRHHQSVTRDDHLSWSRSNHHHHHKHNDDMLDSRSGSSGHDGESILDERVRRSEDDGEIDEEKRLLMKRAKHKHHNQQKHRWREGDSHGDRDYRGSSREDRHKHRHKHSKVDPLV